MRPRLLCVLAHPDDESLGMGGILAKYAAEGVETFLITATCGEKGRYFDRPRPSEPHLVGEARAAELQAAAKTLGLREAVQWNYPDGELDRADPPEIIGRIAAEIARLRPHVVVTFGPDGAYGHPDHIAISQFATAAIVRAAPQHSVAKLYYLAWNQAQWDVYQSAFKQLVSQVDGVVRQANAWPYWMITTAVDTRAHWSTVWRAVQCHRTQMAIYGALEQLNPEQHSTLWGCQTFYRALSTTNGGRIRETDLFSGFREG